MAKTKLQKFLIILIIFLIVSSGATLYMLVFGDFSQNIGTNDIGYVKKYVYGQSENPSMKIAIVSGMHPRENLSEKILPIVSKFYHSDGLQIVNYKVIVTKDDNLFYPSRSNGEKIVSDMVVPDIAKNDFDLVIIGHDHEKGYGQDFYIATPNMDEDSVKLASSVYNLFNSSGVTDFRYYQRNISKKVQSTSILGVNKLVVDTGTPLFVYEVPEWYSEDYTYKMTEKLLNYCVESLK